MGRPRTGEKLKRTVTLSLSEEAIAFLDTLDAPSRSFAVDSLVLAMGRYATEEDAVMAMWFNSYVRGISSQETAPVTRQETPAKRKPVRKSDAIGDLKSALATDKARCPHPAETKHSWGVVCAVCGHRLR